MTSTGRNPIDTTKADLAVLFLVKNSIQNARNKK